MPNIPLVDYSASSTLVQMWRVASLSSLNNNLPEAECYLNLTVIQKVKNAASGFDQRCIGSISGCRRQTSWGIRALTRSVDGRLRINEPFARPCFSKYNGQSISHDEAACTERKDNDKLPSYQNQFPSSYMYEQSTICASDATS